MFTNWTPEAISAENTYRREQLHHLASHRRAGAAPSRTGSTRWWDRLRRNTHRSD
jgi:hypothetical protein